MPKRQIHPTTLVDIRREEARRAQKKETPERTVRDRRSESTMLRDARNVAAARRRQLDVRLDTTDTL